MGHVDHSVIFELEEWQKWCKKSIRWFKKDPEYLLTISEQASTDYSKNLKIWKGIARIKNFEKYSSQKLIALFKKYLDTQLSWDAYLWYHLWMESFFEKELAKVLSKEEYAVAVDPVKKGTVALEQEDLLRLAVEYKKGKDILSGLKKHVEQFGWLVNNNYDMTFLDEKYYLDKIKESENPKKGLQELEEHYNTKVQKYIKLLKKYKNNKQLVQLIKSAQESIFFRSFRTERFYQSAFYVQNLLTEIAQRLGITLKEVVYLVPPEIILHLRKNQHVNKRIIAQRKNCFAYLPPVTREIVVEKELEELKKNIILFDLESSEIKGATAYPGKVTGKVHMVLDQKELIKIQQGDILVCTSTTPGFVPYLHNVAAIITDEGGILCHAAVISREMKIPCIIGTKIATQLLKEGDLVEVDTINGIVRKLSSRTTGHRLVV